MVIKKHISLLLLILVCCSCGIDSSKEENLNWKYGGGHPIGDRVSFEGNYEIKNDTIYQNKTPVGIKVSTIRRLDNSQVLIIKAIKKDQTGTYHAK